MPLCRVLTDIPDARQNLSRKLIGSLFSFYAVQGTPGLFFGVRSCKADTEAGPGQLVAQRQYPTGVLGGFMLLERLRAGDAVLTGNW